MRLVTTELQGPIQDLYPQGIRTCFGCGSDNEQGLRIKSMWDGEKAILRYIPAPHHTAYPGIVNGGIIASLMDCHSLAAAWAHAHQQQGDALGQGEPVNMVTGRLEINYLAPTPLGPELLLTARVEEVKGRKFVVSVSLEAQGKECVRGRAVLVRIPNS